MPGKSIRVSAAIALSLASMLPAAAAPPLVRWDGLTEVAAGRGEKGPWRQNKSRYDYVDDATVAVDAAGGIGVAWVDQQKKDVMFRAFSADGAPKAEPVNVSRNPATFSWLPRIVAAPHDPDTLYLLWQEIVFSGGTHGGDILFARSTDGGASFSAPLNLSKSPGGDGKGRIDRATWSNGSLDLAIGRDGALLAAWTEYDGMLWLARSTDGGVSFAPPAHLFGTKRQPARAPSLATGPGQAVYLAWTVGEDAAADIRVAQSTDGGVSFGPALVVGAGPGHADAPRLAASDTGTLHLAYAESAGGTAGPYHIRYTQSIDGIGKFGVPQMISAPRQDSAAGAAYPSIAVDGQGSLYVMWEVFPDAASRPQGLALTCSRDNGRSFAAPELVPGSIDPRGGTNGSQQGLLAKKLAVGDGGRIAVVNSSLKLNDGSRVWLMHGRLVADGSAGRQGSPDLLPKRLP